MRGKENAPTMKNEEMRSRLRNKKEISYFEGDDKIKRSLASDSDEDAESDWSDKRSKRKKAVKVLKTEVFEDQSSSDEDSYSKMRQKNIASRMELLKSIGIIPPTKTHIKKVPQKKANSTPKDVAEATPRASTRLKNKETGGTINVEPLSSVSTSGVRPQQQRKPSGPLPMVSMIEEDGEDGPAAKCADFLNLLRPFLVKKGGDESELNSCSLDTFKKVMQGLTLTEDQTAKAAPSRVTSMVFHPSEEKHLVAVGCTQGSIGLWDVNNPDPDKCVEVLGPHLNQVNCLSFSSTNPSTLYSTSHDGTVRRGDLIRFVFDEIWACDQSIKSPHATWHEHYQEHSLLIAQGSGKVTLVDTRSPMKEVNWFQCHERSCRTVHLYPANHNYFVTSSGLGEASIWDQRINKELSEPIIKLKHPKGLASAFFSPKGNLLLTTCNDDRLRVFHIGDLHALTTPKVVTNVKHNNHTGRWLSVFKAMWHPLREDAFVVGSLDQDRKIEVYGIHGYVVHNFESEHLTTICSVNAWHPTLPMLAGGNSSGRVHVFKLRLGYCNGMSVASDLALASELIACVSQ